jgi:hypothetical protein
MRKLAFGGLLWSMLMGRVHRHRRRRRRGDNGSCSCSCFESESITVTSLAVGHSLAATLRRHTWRDVSLAE